MVYKEEGGKIMHSLRAIKFTCSGTFIIKVMGFYEAKKQINIKLLVTYFYLIWYYRTPMCQVLH